MSDLLAFTTILPFNGTTREPSTCLAGKEFLFAISDSNIYHRFKYAFAWHRGCQASRGQHENIAYIKIEVRGNLFFPKLFINRASSQHPCTCVEGQKAVIEHRAWEIVRAVESAFARGGKTIVMGTPTLLKTYPYDYDDGTVLEQTEEDKAELAVFPEMTAREIVARTQVLADKAREARRAVVMSTEERKGAEAAGEEMETE